MEGGRIGGPADTGLRDQLIPGSSAPNAYRVLLTRGRDAHEVFVPRLEWLDETSKYLTACGCRPLRAYTGSPVELVGDAVGTADAPLIRPRRKQVLLRSLPAGPVSGSLTLACRAWLKTNGRE